MQIKIDEFGVVLAGGEIWQRMQEEHQANRRPFSIGYNADSGQVIMLGLNSDDPRKFTVIMTEDDIEKFKELTCCRLNKRDALSLTREEVIKDFADTIFQLIMMEGGKVYDKRISAEINN